MTIRPLIYSLSNLSLETKVPNVAGYYAKCCVSSWLFRCSCPAPVSWSDSKYAAVYRLVATEMVEGLAGQATGRGKRDLCS